MIHEQLYNTYGIDRVPDPERFGNGLINDTYIVYCNGQKNLLQRINHKVFKNVSALMANLLQVCNYVNQKFPAETFISVILSKQGRAYEEVEANFWRMLKFIPSTHSYESLTDPLQAYEAGRVIGRFHTLLGEVDISQMQDTIPHFHDLGYRISQFKEAVQSDSYNRAQNCGTEIEFLLQLAEDVLLREQQAQLPARVVHNDTKLNNILFDGQNRGVCMVDLDTLMKGYIVYDTGDALRTLCNPAGEDGSEAPLNFIKDAYLQFIKGYLPETHPFLSMDELLLIPYSVIRMATEQCIRFLGDHLNGDVYFHQPYPGFNYKAAINGFNFIRLIQEKMGWMEQELMYLLQRIRG